jgi:hypothetical protein
MVNALSFVSMGVEARCCPCHSTAHCRHMKRQPCLCPPHGCHHCNHHRHLRHRCRLCHHRHCCCPLPLLSAMLLWSPSTIAAAVSVASPSAIAVAVAITLAIGHCRLCHRQPLQLPSPFAITVTIAVGHLQELLPWCSKNCIQLIEAKNAHLILFCLDSGRRTDQSWMTDQVSGGNGQHQRWAASGKQ